MKSIILLALAVAVVSANMLENAAITQNIIDEVNNSGASWKAGVNEKFSKATIKEAKHLCGVLPSKRSLPMGEIPNVAAPDTFDARTQWPQCPSVGHIRDQANCGSCWAFGAAEAWSDRVCITTNAKIVAPMSTDDLLCCCGYTCGWGCNGGSLDGAWSYIQQTGLVTGGDYNDNNYCAPYPLKPCDHHINGTYGPCPDEVPTPACQPKCVASYSGTWANDKHKANKIYSVNGEQNMMNEIYAHGPIEAAFTVYNDFLTYKSGVYTHVTGAYLGGHAIRILGWGVENNIKYWLVANSWNEGWGDKGYFKIKRGTGECGIESDGYAGMYQA